MIRLYTCGPDTLVPCEVSPETIRRAVWIDLLAPTQQDEAVLEGTLGINVPTPEEMAEIEVSSRLYHENDTLYMTATVLAGTETSMPVGTPVTFILSPERLITVRHAAPKAFEIFAGMAARPGAGQTGVETAFVGLLDAIVNRLADVLEVVASEVDGLSRTIFEHTSIRAQDRPDFEEVLRQIGRKGDLTSKVREALVSLGRLTHFAAAATVPQVTDSLRARLDTVARDIAPLSDHATFLAQKINFLLDATLGLLNIEQNAIIKIFSVVAVIFLPPTLIASIYGMNFELMPELGWRLGYPFALLLMIASAILPYWYFKRRRWL
ncbi:magnesium transporter CorA family protein [Propylenella binzhouense]|uniref:Magnesium transport protein CorA n=1 Tax=Propylenella binzhouense TaxID=2555902 RepID=A0A964T495_9HYPH|nr:magnesium transporter CorA family protein [Propylenella binzhouense]MYZ47920.1 magnesium transporter [Propylenella binzhouense]